MIKLAVLAFIPALAATYYAHHDLPSASPRTWPGVEEQDRQFLGALDRQQPNPFSTGSVAETDHAFLASLEFDERLARLRAQRELPALRAIPVEHPTAIPLASVVTSAHLPASPAGDLPEIRRAVAVVAPSTSPANLRDAFREPFVTMMKPEVRRAVAVHQPRASILITGTEVIVRP